MNVEFIKQFLFRGKDVVSLTTQPAESIPFYRVGSLSLVWSWLGILRKPWAALARGPKVGLPAGTAVLGWAGPLLPETTICRGSLGVNQ